MVIALLAIITGLYWLLIESHYLTVKLSGGPLLCGQYERWIITDDMVTDEMKRELINRFNLDNRYYGALEPMGGWGYMYQYQYFNPPVEVTISYPGVKHTVKFWNHDRKLLNRAVKSICADFKPKARKALYV